jgi:cyclic pyranopterin phosphate synthase
MPEEGIKLLKHEDILSLEEIADFTKIAAAKGIDKVRITGGEPLVRKGIARLINLISQIKEITEISLTTNGILLEEFAQPLADAGLHRVNISLDTVDPYKFRELTRGGDIQKVIQGIMAAKNAGLLPVKINCVVDNSSEEPDAIGVKDFCKTMGIEARFIHRMTLDEGKFAVVEGGTGGNCKICNKLRLSSDGFLRPCLFNDAAFNIRQLGYENAINAALQAKPECGTVSFKNTFNTIGG